MRLRASCYSCAHSTLAARPPLILRTLFVQEGPAPDGYRVRTPYAFGADIAAPTLPLTVKTAGV